MARGAIVPLFPDVFVALSRLVADNDAQLRTGSEMLDKLLKVFVKQQILWIA